MQTGIVNKAHQFWKDTNLVEYQILLLMESAEPQPENISSELGALLQQLDQSFDQPGGVDFDQSLGLLKVLSSLSVVLEFYLVRRYDLAYPGASADILGLANSHLKDTEYGAYANHLLRRHIVFERMKILRRVFDLERLSTIGDFVKENGKNY